MLTFLHNSPEHKPLRRLLRKHSTHAEILLWSRLRNNAIGVRFRRQFGIGSYVVDFYCYERKIIIEVDGLSHDSDHAQFQDSVRQRYLESCENVCLRYTDKQVLTETESVLQDIRNHIGTPPRLP